MVGLGSSANAGRLTAKALRSEVRRKIDERRDAEAQREESLLLFIFFRSFFFGELFHGGFGWLGFEGFCVG